VLLKELDEVFLDRKNSFVKTQAKFFADAFNLTEESCFEEFLFAAN
jgi:hypothetical protein